MLVVDDDADIAPVFNQPTASRPPESVPAFSNRRVAQAQQEIPRSQPASGRVPTRERASHSFPAFDTDWDVPAFQRKGQ